MKKSNPPKSDHKGRQKVHSSRSPASQSTYVCEKHRRRARAVHKMAPRLSAGDSHLSELGHDGEKANLDADTNQTTHQPKPIPSTHSIPFVLARKPKHGEDPKRIAADAIHGASIQKREYLHLRKQSSTVRETDKNPNNCNIKVIKFHNVEIIEQHDPQMEQEGKVILKIIHKSRQLQQPQMRLDLVSNEDTDLTKMIMEYILKQWADIVKMWKLEGYLQQVEPYETVEFDARQHQTPVPASPGSSSRSSSSSSSSSPDLYELPRRDSIKRVIEYEQPDHSEHTRSMVRQYLAKKGPVYQETITTQLRYNFRRKKRFYPVHLMEHVLKYKRPPFWNYARKYGGFNVLLDKYQLEHLYEYVPPQAT